MKKVENLIFDLETFVDFNRLELFEYCNICGEDYKNIYDEIFCKAMPMMNASVITKEEAIKMSCTNLANKGNEYLIPSCLAVYNCLYDFIKIDRQMLDLISNLNKCGYKCYVFSNANEELASAVKDAVDESHKYYEMFSRVLLSYQLKLLKPSIVAFREFCYRCDLIPVKCLYIDDGQKTIEIAKKIGMQTYLFYGYKKLGYKNFNKYLHNKKIIV